MPLIPEAAAIKETLKHADALSGAVAEEMKLMQQPTAEELAPLMCADRKSTRLNSSHIPLSRMPSSA